MFRHIRTRLATLYAGLFTAALIMVAAVLYVVVATTAERQVRDELVASSTVFDRLWHMRSRELGNAAGVLARDFGFREAVATGDRETAESALDNLKSRLGLEVAFIVGIDGSIIGASRPGVRRDAAKLWPALDRGESSGVASLDGVSHQLVAAPIMAPALTGWAVFATDLGAGEMSELERLSAIPIRAAVLTRNKGGGWSSAGAPPATDEARAIARFVDRRTGTGDPGELETAEGTSIALAKPLRSIGDGERAVLLLRYPLARAMAAYQPLQIAMALTGLIGLGLLIFGSWRLSLSITKPISALDHAARRLGLGESGEVPVGAGGGRGRWCVGCHQ